MLSKTGWHNPLQHSSHNDFYERYWKWRMQQFYWMVSFIITTKIISARKPHDLLFCQLYTFDTALSVLVIKQNTLVCTFQTNKNCWWHCRWSRYDSDYSATVISMCWRSCRLSIGDVTRVLPIFCLCCPLQLLSLLFFHLGLRDPPNHSFHSTKSMK